MPTNNSILPDYEEGFDSDVEVIEQSTVQYILCDDPPSDDDELTFAELQASLQSFKTGIPNPPKQLAPSLPLKTDKPAKFSPKLKSTPKVLLAQCQIKQSPHTVPRATYKGPKKARMTNNLLQAHRKIKKEIEDPSYGDYSCLNSSDELSRAQTSVLESSPTAARVVKRSRKQQLTVVNRTDSEIIIQPASAYSEEDEVEVISYRKRGRRKKQESKDPDYNPRKPTPGRKPPRKSNARRVEVIELDADEAEKAKKGSSDKENDVISLADSADDKQQSTTTASAKKKRQQQQQQKKKKKVAKPMMQCSHCSRNFRKRQALEKHLQSCAKAPASIKKPKPVVAGGKMYACKTCEETFDMALGLARHVRLVHMPRKAAGRPVTRSMRVEVEAEEEDEEEETTTEESEEESEEESTPEPEPRRRSRGVASKSIGRENKG